MDRVIKPEWNQGENKTRCYDLFVGDIVTPISDGTWDNTENKIEPCIVLYNTTTDGEYTDALKKRKVHYIDLYHFGLEKYFRLVWMNSETSWLGEDRIGFSDNRLVVSSSPSAEPKYSMFIRRGKQEGKRVFIEQPYFQQWTYLRIINAP